MTGSYWYIKQKTAPYLVLNNGNLLLVGTYYLCDVDMITDPYTNDGDTFENDTSVTDTTMNTIVLDSNRC